MYELIVVLGSRFDRLCAGLLAALANVRQIEDYLFGRLFLYRLLGLLLDLWFILLLFVGLLLIALIDLLLFLLFFLTLLYFLFLLIVVHSKHFIILDTILKQFNSIFSWKIPPLLIVLRLYKRKYILPQTFT